LQTGEEIMPSSPQWHFERYRLDPHDARLWRGDQAVALTLKAFGVLHYLVTHAGQLVTKEALLDAVWPKTAVSDAALRVVISELRKALGDAAHAPQFIATVQRLGYRFLAPVSRITPSEECQENGPPPSTLSLSPEEPPLKEPPMLTVLCGVLPNVSARSTELGPDDLHRLMQLVSDLTMREVQRYKGMIQYVIGRGFLALYDVPVEQED
jgi:DNA-binding winged helix-turn-helix (wHTH) protein